MNGTQIYSLSNCRLDKRTENEATKVPNISYLSGGTHLGIYTLPPAAIAYPVKNSHSPFPNRFG